MRPNGSSHRARTDGLPGAGCAALALPRRCGELAGRSLDPGAIHSGILEKGAHPRIG